MDKKKVLHDLIELEYYQGYHSGRWHDELDRGDSSEYYLKKMKSFADTYNIEYDDNLSNYGDEDDYIYQKQDEMGYIIKEKVERHLVELLLGC